MTWRDLKSFISNFEDEQLDHNVIICDQTTDEERFLQSFDMLVSIYCDTIKVKDGQRMILCKDIYA